MEAQILEFAAFKAALSIAIGLAVILACCIAAYRNWRRCGELGAVQAAFVIAMCAAFLMLLDGIDLYKIKNYPLAYIDEHAKSAQCK